MQLSLWVLPMPMSVHSTTRRKNSLPSVLPEGSCRSHTSEGSYFTLGLQRAQQACLGSRERSGGRRRRKENRAMELESVLKSFTTLAGYKCNSLKRLWFLMFVWFSLYNLSKEIFIILGFFSEFLSPLLSSLFISV